MKGKEALHVAEFVFAVLLYPALVFAPTAWALMRWDALEGGAWMAAVVLGGLVVLRVIWRERSNRRG